jgi:hypothetical protein
VYANNGATIKHSKGGVLYAGYAQELEELGKSFA